MHSSYSSAGEPRLIIEGLHERLKPVFKTRADYEKFREDFYRAVKPELDRQQRARAESEEAARHHLVY